MYRAYECTEHECTEHGCKKHECAKHEFRKHVCKADAWVGLGLFSFSGSRVLPAYGTTFHGITGFFLGIPAKPDWLITHMEGRMIKYVEVRVMGKICTRGKNKDLVWMTHCR